MAKNIEINVKTSDGYEVLYPKVNGSNTEINSEILEKFGVEKGNLNDVFEKLSESVGYKEDSLKISDFGETWTAKDLTGSGSYGRRYIIVGNYIFYSTGKNVKGINVEDLSEIFFENVTGGTRALNGIFKINDNSFGVWSEEYIAITNDLGETWETHKTPTTLNNQASICVYKNKMYIFGTGNSNESCAISTDSSFSSFETYSAPNGVFGMVACTDNLLMYTYGNYSDSRYRYYYYTTSSNPSKITGSDWIGGSDYKAPVYELFSCNGYIWNPVDSNPRIKGYYIDSQGTLQYKELDIGDASGTAVYGESITGITYDGERYWVSLSSSKKENGNGFSGLYSIMEDGTAPVENNDLSTEAIICNQNFLLRYTTTYYDGSYTSYSQVAAQTNNYLVNMLQEKLRFSGEIIFEYGTFIGTGKYGTYNNSTLVFSKRPRWVVFPNYYTMIFSGMVDRGKSSPAENGGNQYCGYAWKENILSWNCISGTSVQMSELNKKYWYFAIY